MTPGERESQKPKSKKPKFKIVGPAGKTMRHADSEPKTIITVDLDIDTIEKAEFLGLDLSEMANRLLLAEVQRLKQQPEHHESKIAAPP